MNLPEAIKELTDMANDAWDADREVEADACQLGIEALKRIQVHREHVEEEAINLLPGETEK